MGGKRGTASITVGTTTPSGAMMCGAAWKHCTERASSRSGLISRSRIASPMAGRITEHGEVSRRRQARKEIDREATAIVVEQRLHARGILGSQHEPGMVAPVQAMDDLRVRIGR